MERLLETCTDFDILGEAGKDGATFGADSGGYDHAVGLDAAEFARLEVDHHDNLAADQLFGFVVLRNSGANLAYLAADIDRQLQQFVRAHDALRGFDLTYPHLHLGELFDPDLVRRCGRGCRTGRYAGRDTWSYRCRLFLCFVFHYFHPLYGFCLVDPWEKRQGFLQ